MAEPKPQTASLNESVRIGESSTSTEAADIQRSLQGLLDEMQGLRQRLPFGGVAVGGRAGLREARKRKRALTVSTSRSEEPKLLFGQEVFDIILIREALNGRLPWNEVPAIEGHWSKLIFNKLSGEVFFDETPELFIIDRFLNSSYVHELTSKRVFQTRIKRYLAREKEPSKTELSVPDKNDSELELEIIDRIESYARSLELDSDGKHGLYSRLITAFQKARDGSDPIHEHILRVQPVKWKGKRGRGGGPESPVEFIRRVYGPQGGNWLGHGLTRAHITRYDPTLSQAYGNWVRRHPEDILDLPTLSKAGQGEKSDAQYLSEIRARAARGMARRRK